MLSWPVEPHKVFRKDLGIDSEGLRLEALDAIRQAPFEDGYRGLSIALPRRDQITENGKYSSVNQPFRGVLDDYPIMSRLFETFEPGVRAFRLLMRPKASSYHVHRDAPYRPGGMYRMQIPVITSDKCVLCTTDLWGPDYLYSAPWPQFDNGTQLTRRIFEEAFEEQGKCWQLTPGYLYHFRNDSYHTLINDSIDEDRITLLIDMDHGPWVVDFIRSFTEIQPL